VHDLQANAVTASEERIILDPNLRPPWGFMKQHKGMRRQSKAAGHSCFNSDRFGTVRGVETHLLIAFLVKDYYVAHIFNGNQRNIIIRWLWLLL